MNDDFCARVWSLGLEGCRHFRRFLSAEITRWLNELIWKLNSNFFGGKEDNRVARNGAKSFIVVRFFSCSAFDNQITASTVSIRCPASSFTLVGILSILAGKGDEFQLTRPPTRVKNLTDSMADDDVIRSVLTVRGNWIRGPHWLNNLLRFFSFKK